MSPIEKILHAASGIEALDPNRSALSDIPGTRKSAQKASAIRTSAGPPSAPNPTSTERTTTIVSRMNTAVPMFLISLSRAARECRPPAPGPPRPLPPQYVL
jgi:hypothetical protein